MDITPNLSHSNVADDVHASKITPGDPRLQIPLPRGRTLKKGPAMAVAILVAGVVALALAFAIQPAKKPGAKEDAESVSYRPPLPDAIATAPDNTSPLDTGAGHPKTATDRGLPDVTPDLVPAAPASDHAQEQAQKDAATELARARSGTIFAEVGGDAQDRNPPRAVSPRGASSASLAAAGGADGNSASGASGNHAGGAGDNSAVQDPNHQERKNDFLNASEKAIDPYVEQPVLKPRSPYQVMAGTIIPTVLITGINSDLPGQIIGQVRENVYDTVDGAYLLIPQGSRLLATYDSLVAWGQERVLLCWNRLIRPDGSSISLPCMPGVDLAGYAGVADSVDNHWWRIITGASLSSLLAVGASSAGGDVKGYNPNLAQQWAAGAAGDIASTGQQITRRNLNMQPTITVRPGFSVNVIVTKDMVLNPYTG